ncbi:hypothetical protein CIL05_19955 [Virgibacillus profundi]|uniref:Uncharacterized protein n=1 Tax=Virgibacillus profundi TaxID=2024555 RepID=A0A2A2I9K6_9BACI|nr:DUF3231 family protein [Virgibacillus profundi]PAV27825.1 hypothetical protein CIL05_19955 [Virgibacillus profundi]PXY51952.1 DUF3231 domain-containing protein [Virgibacillus profundi]
MGNHEHIELTAAEISTLWTAYLSDTMGICGIKHFLTNVEDEQIRSILEDTKKFMEDNTTALKDFFNKENYPIPQGFTEKDVDLTAPRLFSDRLYLEFVFNLTIMSLAVYSVSLSVAERGDVMDYYADNLRKVIELHLQAKELSKAKGTFIRTPQIPKPNQIDFVKNKSFLAGWFSDRRPLLGVEITNLVFNAKRNAIGHAIITGFSQVAKSKEIRSYFEKGRDISLKHMEIFSSILHEDNMHDGALLLTSEVTDSTVSPFSDKLMTFLITTLIATGMGQYGTSMSVSPRHDLGVHYARLVAEIAKYSNEGAKILIDHGWMEQPPMAADRKDLAK